MNKWNYQVRSHRPQHNERPLSAKSEHSVKPFEQSASDPKQTFGMSPIICHYQPVPAVHCMNKCQEFRRDIDKTTDQY